MPFIYRIFPEIDLCYGRYEGRLTPAAIASTYSRYLQDPDYRTGRPHLIDLRPATCSDVDMQVMRNVIGRMNASVREGMPAAMIVILTDSDAAFGQARQFQTLASLRDGIRVLLERDEAGALAQLGRAETSLGEFLSVFAPDLVPDPPA